MSGYDPTNPKHRAETEAARKRREATAIALETEDIRWLVSEERGRRIVRRLLSQLRVDEPYFSTNALEMARIAGRQEVGVALKLLVARSSPEHAIKLFEESLPDLTS